MDDRGEERSGGGEERRGGAAGLVCVECDSEAALRIQQSVFTGRTGATAVSSGNIDFSLLI